MLAARALVLISGLLAILSLGAYIVTGQERFRRWGVNILKWTLAAAVLFFATLIISRAL